MACYVKASMRMSKSPKSVKCHPSKKPCGRWFRFYEADRQNPAIDALPPPLFRIFVYLMTLASRDGGRLPETWDIAAELKLPATELGAAVTALTAAGLVERSCGDLVMTDWRRRQFVALTDAQVAKSTLRVRRHRARKKAAQAKNKKNKEHKATLKAAANALQEAGYTISLNDDHDPVSVSGFDTNNVTNDDETFTTFTSLPYTQGAHVARNRPCHADISPYHDSEVEPCGEADADTGSDLADLLEADAESIVAGRAAAEVVRQGDDDLTQCPDLGAGHAPAAELGPSDQDEAPSQPLPDPSFPLPEPTGRSVAAAPIRGRQPAPREAEGLQPAKAPKPAWLLLMARADDGTLHPVGEFDPRQLPVKWLLGMKPRRRKGGPGYETGYVVGRGAGRGRPS